jgi:hypothetical protein
MPSSTLLVARRILLALAFATPFAAVQAQQPAPAAAPAASRKGPRGNRYQIRSRPRAKADATRRSRTIHTEDSGASVDEVRYGGRTQSINVKPKSNMPGYEVLPADQADGAPGLLRDRCQRPRVWNVMKF